MSDLSTLGYSLHTTSTNGHSHEPICGSPLTSTADGYFSKMWRVPSSASITYEVEMPDGVLVETLVYSEQSQRERGKMAEVMPNREESTVKNTPLPPISLLSHSHPLHSVDPHLLLPDFGFNYEELHMPQSTAVSMNAVEERRSFAGSCSPSPFPVESCSPTQAVVEMHPHQLSTPSPQLPTLQQLRPCTREQQVSSPPKHEVIRYKREDMCTSPLIPVRREIKKNNVKKPRRCSIPYPRRSREEIGQSTFESPRSSTSSASPTSSAMMLPSDVVRDPTPPIADFNDQHLDIDLSLPSPDMLNSMIQGLHSVKRF